jgi:hypothetical protein
MRYFLLSRTEYIAAHRASYLSVQSGKVPMSPLQRLADALSELAETGNDAELEEALGLCLGFADIVMPEPNIDEAFAELRERSETKISPVRRIN